MTWLPYSRCQRPACDFLIRHYKRAVRLPSHTEELILKGYLMLEVQLHGSHEASCLGTKFSHPRKDPVAPLLRSLLNTGTIKEDDMVVVKRGSVMCFNPTAVKNWTDRTIICQDKGGFTNTKYVPFTYAP